MISTIQILVLLLAVVAAVAVLSARLKIPPAILLVLTGVVLALVPGLPALALAPELVLLLVLPPVIYASAVAMSWREFRFNLRPISLLAVGCVVFTTIAVAAAAHFVSPGQSVSSWALLFRRRTLWRRSPSLAECSSPGGSLSSSKAKGLQMMPPR
jgi:NhaP-type Na+/H+ or K+/H+ antiporter